VTKIDSAALGSDRPITYDREKILELLALPEIDLHLSVAEVDRGDLRRLFEGLKVEPLNEGQVVPATSPNTDFFPRDEYDLFRP
jgi:hypothetical protein